MIDIVEILKTNPKYGVLATQDGNKVKTRLFQYFHLDGNKVYFGTNNDKPVYAQLKANPNVSFCIYPKDFKPVISLNGKVVFVDYTELMKLPEAKNFQTPDDPTQKIFFYIEVEEIQTFSYADGSKIYKI
jgi:uncharacterized pyridoxamine 5'-phosphate oxidase family protein